ncbi:T9SS type A sorting domain-containing protein [Hyunsoonleella ulvae]|uniref:T9SS type A sorting domain-containing protein n=1 Tax=Hyunsoonleella ulvae TaxID=2799948 RepID=UPI0019393E74|nr:T9SS type A sorting domain-containing protein [Hyunsoonleella ulvae]
MITKLFLGTFLFLCFQINAQNNNWYQYARPLSINQMVKGPNGNYHYATNIGYQKLDNNFNTIEVKNLTTQKTAIGNCFSIAVNPNNGNSFALGENDRVIIFTNGVETNQVSVNAVNPFTGPNLYYNNNNVLYIFNENDSNNESYSIFENGTLTEVATPGIRPKDMIENNAGTKLFIADTNNGLWEYTKATDTWVNYTKDNSNLLSNFINDLFVDTNDNLLVGSYEGINKIEPNGTITSCTPPSFSPVFELDVHPNSGEIVARTSQPNSANTFGFYTVNFNTCTWQNFTNDGNSCIQENMFKTVQFSSTPSDGKIVASGAQLSAENTYVFDPSNPTNSCDYIDFNYMGAPLRVDINYVTDMNVRKTSDGKYDIGACNGSDTLFYFSITPETFDGTFSPATSVTLPQPAFSILSDNGFFIVDSNESFSFIDENDNNTSFSHNLSNHLVISSKKTALEDSDDGIINILTKAFDAAFNYRVYKTQCDTNTGNCSVLEEIFTNDRDLTKNIIFGANEDPATNKIDVVAVKTDASGALKRTSESWESNQPAVSNWDRIHDVFPRFDPVVFSFVLDDLINIASFFAPPQEDVVNLVEDANDGNTKTTSITTDTNNDNTNEDVKVVTELILTDDEATKFIGAILIGLEQFSTSSALTFYGKYVYLKNIDPVTKNLLPEERDITDVSWVTKDQPKDLIIKKAKAIQYDANHALMVFLTNYGILLKTDLNISNLTLNVNDVSFNEKHITIYPNPSKGLVSFSDKTVQKISVYDTNGRQILESGSNSISIKNISKGIYIVKGTTSENVTITRKLIKN